jgi:hypothetical protein
VIDRFVSQETDANTPITEMVVNSLITNVATGQQVPSGRAFEVKGIAWDGGYGIARVEVSADLGQSWRTAALGTDFRALFVPDRGALRRRPIDKGTLTLMARATESQRRDADFRAHSEPSRLSPQRRPARRADRHVR